MVAILGRLFEQTQSSDRLARSFSDPRVQVVNLEHSRSSLHARIESFALVLSASLNYVNTATYISDPLPSSLSIPNFMSLDFTLLRTNTTTS